MTWLVNGKTIARKVKNRNHGITNANAGADGQEDDAACERIIECPSCGNVLEEGNITTPRWPGLPAGVKFDPTDCEILEHLAAKLGVKEAKAPHPYIDVFIPTLDGENGIYYTHPERLPDIKLDGNSIHYFHRPIRAFMKGTRKRRKIEGPGNGVEVRWHKTGRTRPVMGNGTQLGFKKIMVLYSGTPWKDAQGLGKTNWIMHQYHIGMNEEEKEGEYVVAKIFYQTQPRQSSANRKPGPLDGDVHPGCEHDALHELDEVREEPTLLGFVTGSEVEYNAKPGMTSYADKHIDKPKGLLHTLAEDAQRMWSEMFQDTLHFPGQGVKEQGECSHTRRSEPQQEAAASMNSQMAQHGLLERSTNSLKLTDTDLFNILSNQEIRAALKGKTPDEMMPTMEVQGNITEIGGSKEDLANKFEALENIMLETPPDFIIGSLLNSQEALEALEMFKSWSDSQKGDDNLNFTDLFK